MSQPVITVHPDTRIEDVVDKLLAKHIGAVLVVDEAGTPVGMVSESDLLYRVAHYGLPPHVEILGSIIYLDTPSHIHERQQKASAVYARDIMSGPIISIGPDASIEDVADMLITRKVHRLVIMEDGHVLGIITRGDVVRQSLARQWASRSASPST